MKKETKRAAAVMAVFMFIVSFAGCGKPVQSSELAETDPSDLRFEGLVREYKDDSLSKVSAKMETVQSENAIDLTQGETLKATSDKEGGLNDAVFLSSDYFLNLSNDYVGYVAKTIAGGNYYLTYTDKDGESATVTVVAGTVSDILTPANGATLSGDTVNITWDPEQMNGEVWITITWSGSSSSGASHRIVENTGSYDFGISGMNGTGEMELINKNTYHDIEGFAASDVYMENVARIDVTFSRSAVGTMGAKTAVAGSEKSFETPEEILAKCQRECAEGEIESFTIDEVEYSCCVEK